MIQPELHTDMLLILPQIAITCGACADPACEASHWRITLGWLVGSVHFYL